MMESWKWRKKIWKL